MARGGPDPLIRLLRAASVPDAVVVHSSATLVNALRCVEQNLGGEYGGSDIRLFLFLLVFQSFQSVLVHVVESEKAFNNLSRIGAI